MIGSYTLGLIFIFLVGVFWISGGVLVQYVYTEEAFESPFLLTYIGTSLFALFLPMEWLSEKIAEWRCHRNGVEDEDAAAAAAGVVVGGEKVVTGGGGDSNNTTNNTKKGSSLPSSSSSSSSTKPATNSSSLKDKLIQHHNEEDDEADWTLRDHAYAAAKVAPLYFLDNYCYNASLKYTTITSTTILACTGSLFAFLFALLLRDEKFSWYKFLGVALGILGSVLMALHDKDDDFDSSVRGNAADAAGDDYYGFNSDDDSKWNYLHLWGDVMGLLSAAGYGAYTVVLHVVCPRDESRMKMQIFLGFLGLWTFVLLSPVVLFFQLFSPAAASNLTLFVLSCVILKGLLDNVLGDYSYARAVVLTSATVASVGVGLQVPMAFLSDIIFLGRTDIINAVTILSALSVLIGFLLVNLGQHLEFKKEAEAEAEANKNNNENQTGNQESSSKESASRYHNHNFAKDRQEPWCSADGSDPYGDRHSYYSKMEIEAGDDN